MAGEKKPRYIGDQIKPIYRIDLVMQGLPSGACFIILCPQYTNIYGEYKKFFPDDALEKTSDIYQKLSDGRVVHLYSGMVAETKDFLRVSAGSILVQVKLNFTLEKV